MTTRTVRIICLDCQTTAPHSGRGLCHTCYRNHRADGTLHHYPSVRGNREWQTSHRLTPTHTPATPEPATPVHLDAGERWLDRAACRDHDPELWFPVGDNSDNPAIEQAKTICRACPVLTACAAWVTANPQDHGIWAGLTPKERRRQRAHTIARSTA